LRVAIVAFLASFNLPVPADRLFLFPRDGGIAQLESDEQDHHEREVTDDAREACVIHEEGKTITAYPLPNPKKNCRAMRLLPDRFSSVLRGICSLHRH
jgi:hypothetical protein